MKKVLTLSLLIIIFINSFYTSFALENDDILIKYKGDCKLYLKYQNQYKQVHYAIYEKDGIEYPAYCMNPEYSGVGSEGRNEYEVEISGKIVEEKVWNVVINGYPYKSLEELGVKNKDEAYVATQFAIYTALENRNPNDYSPDNSEEGRRCYNAYLKIIEASKKTNEKSNTNLKLKPENENWKIDNVDYLSKTFTLEANGINGSYKLSLEKDDINKKITDIDGNEKDEFEIGKQFKILIPVADLKDDDYELKINAKVKIYTNPIYFGKTTIEKTQNYCLTGNQFEETEISYKEVIDEKLGKIKIIKTDANTKERLQGVVFNLLNSNKDIVIQELITDSNGEICIDNLEPGIYYIQEIKTLDGYTKNSEIQEVELNLNDIKEIIIENSKVENKLEVIKKLPVTGY